MDMTPELSAALDRLASALVKHERVARALHESAGRLADAPQATDAAVAAFTRCELAERRARLHVELARKRLGALRAQLRDDQRRVPARFRKRHAERLPSLDIVGRGDLEASAVSGRLRAAERPG